MRGRPFKKGKRGNPGDRPKVIAELRALARAHAPDAIKELARLAIKAKSEAPRVAAIRKLLDQGYGKTAQMQATENEVGLSDSTAEELRTELLADFAAAFPDLRIPATMPNSLARTNGSICARGTARAKRRSSAIAILISAGASARSRRLTFKGRLAWMS